MLIKLAQSRRDAARARQAEEVALESAHMDAQREWGRRLDSALHEAERARQNVKMMALDSQTRALRALGEVRSTPCFYFS